MSEGNSYSNFSAYYSHVCTNNCFLRVSDISLHNLFNKNGVKIHLHIKLYRNKTHINNFSQIGILQTELNLNSSGQNPNHVLGDKLSRAFLRSNIALIGMVCIKLFL